MIPEGLPGFTEILLNEINSLVKYVFLNKKKFIF